MRKFLIASFSYHAFALVSLDCLGEDYLRKFLHVLLEKIKVAPLGEPQIHIFPLTEENHKRVSGMTLLQTIQESHLAIHTWPEIPRGVKDSGFFELWICSCKEFDPLKVRQALKRVFKQISVFDEEFSNKSLQQGEFNRQDL